MSAVHIGMPVVCIFSSLLVAAAVEAETLPLRGPIPFEVFDTDNNQMISPEEFVTTHNLRMKERSDANMTAPRGMFERGFIFYDSNGDSLISPEELNAQRQQRGRARGPEQSRQQGFQRPGRQEGRARPQMPAFGEFDLNGDGVLRKEEFYSAREQRMRKRYEQGYKMRNVAIAPPFNIVDNNRDGEVTEEEFTQHQAEYLKRQGW